MAGRLKSLRDEIAPLGDPMIVRAYYAKLIELSGAYSKSPSSVSLSDYMGPLFQFARERSRTADPTDENQAAILALAMYFGDWRFGRLIGPVLTEEMKKHRPPRQVTLGGRRDLKLHFIISAGLKIVSDSGLSYTAGEFKELLDASKGGSGFSFRDLAADIAGVRFAEVATERSGGAERIQRTISKSGKEDAFFPDVKRFPEGIGAEEFERRYGNVKSKAYRSVLSEIEKAIGQCSAYKALAG
jgi:hypothetical protein